MLVEEGWAGGAGSNAHHGAMPEPVDPEATLAGLQEQYPECIAELTLLANCGSRLAEVLRGTADPLQILFPSGSTALLEKLYRDSPFARSLNALLEESIARLIEELPSRRPLKILEIGAGTGGATAQLLPRLPADRTEYVFTDVSSAFTQAAAEKFRGCHFLRYARLDIETDPGQQGFAPHQFDLVLAANVLHATRDLRQSLAHAHSLLASQGALVLLEGTRPQRWLDLIFGLTEGWWRFADVDLRPRHPMITAENWLRLLADEDFDDAVALPEPACAAGELPPPQAVLLARAGLERADRRVSGVNRTWEDGALRTEADRSSTAGWLVLADRRGVGELVAKLLRAAGRRCAIVHRGESYDRLDGMHYVVGCRRDLGRVFQEEGVPNVGQWQGVVHLWGLDSADANDLTASKLQDAQELGCQSAVELLQELSALGKAPLPRIWLVTRGAQPVGDGPGVPGLAQSPLWGLGRVLAEEHPALWGGLIDLDPRSPLEDAAELLRDELLVSDGEDQVAYRGGQRFAARIVRKGAAAADHAMRWRADASYLISGGLGNLGIQIAQWMVNQGARHLLCLSRHELPPRDQWQNAARGTSSEAAQLRALRAMEVCGARVCVAAVDIDDPAALEAFLQRIAGEGWPPVRGVIHAAGVIDPRRLLEIGPEQLADVLRPKVTGAWLLHHLLRNERLDFFVAFSSAAAIFGSPLLGGYAAANSFLDALAHQRCAEGKPGLSINWGFWERVEPDCRQQRFTDLRILPEGVQLLTVPDGLAALERLLQQRATQTAVLPVDVDRWLRGRLPAGQSPLLANLRLAESDDQLLAGRRESEAASVTRNTIQAAPAEARGAMAEDYLRQQLGRVLRMPAAALDVRQPLNSLGIDSLMAIELRNRVHADLGVMVPLGRLLQDPTIAQLVEVVLAELDGSPETDHLLPPTDRPKVEDGKPEKPLASSSAPAPFPPRARRQRTADSACRPRPSSPGLMTFRTRRSTPCFAGCSRNKRTVHD